MSETTVILRLLLSLALGGIVGYQREAVDRPAGFRTHVLVCIGATLITLVSIDGFPGSDKARVASQIVTGIGFLGAGTIIRQGSIVRGLTTAASIWAVAGVGISVGAGFYLGSIVGTVIIYLVLSYGKRMEHELIIRSIEKGILVTALNNPGQFGKVDSVLASENVKMTGMELVEESGEEATARIAMKLPPNSNMDFIKSRIAEIDGVIEVSWEA